MDPMDEPVKSGSGDREDPRADVEREGLESRPSQRHPGDGEVPTGDSSRRSSEESEADEDAAK